MQDLPFEGDAREGGKNLSSVLNTRDERARSGDGGRRADTFGDYIPRIERQQAEAWEWWLKKMLGNLGIPTCIGIPYQVSPR